MFTYECVVRFGHLGAGSAWERRVRVRASSIVEAMRRARSLPGAKKGRSASVMRVALVP